MNGTATSCNLEEKERQTMIKMKKVNVLWRTPPSINWIKIHGPQNQQVLGPAEGCGVI